MGTCHDDLHHELEQRIRTLESKHRIVVVAMVILGLVVIFALVSHL